jgi:hypothetical protein
MTLISVTLGQKRLEMLRELMPKASVIAMLANPVSPDAAEIGPVQAAARSLGLELAVINASTPKETLSPLSLKDGPMHSSSALIPFYFSSARTLLHGSGI